MSEQKTTDNIYLAAAYLTLGARYVEKDTHNPSKVKFIFTGLDFEEIDYQWHCRKLMVNARDYAESVREIKSELHAE